MSKVANIINSLSHNASLLKELNGKSIAQKTKIMLRETRCQVADEVLSNKASDAIKASVTPQIRIAYKNLLPEVEKSVKESQEKIKRLGLIVDEEAQKITERYIEYANRKSASSNDFELIEIIKESMKLSKECIKKGYNYLEGYTPIKLSDQTNKTLLNIVNEYRPRYGTISIYEKALQILKERGVM